LVTRVKVGLKKPYLKPESGLKGQLSWRLHGQLVRRVLHRLGSPEFGAGGARWRIGMPLN